ncbi:MAG: CHAT domain-containing tetratricopeptide repeat protein [Bacteroidota bacterium]
MKRPGIHITPFVLLLFLPGIAFLIAWQSTETPSQIFQQGQSLWRAGEYDSALVQYRKAQQQAFAEQDSQTYLLALEASGKYYSRQMRFPEASAALDSVLMWEKNVGTLHPAIFFAKKEKAYMQLVSGKIAESLASYQVIEADFAAAGSEADSLKAFLLEAMGQAFLYNGEFQKGLDYAQNALKLYESVYPPDAPEVSTCLNTIGGIALYMGNHVVSLDAFQESAAIREKRFGPHHPEVLQVKTNIGVLYGEMGRFWQALEIHQTILPHLEKLPTRGHLNGLLNLGATLIVVGDYDEALAYFDLAENYLQDYPELLRSNQAYLDFQRSVIYQSMGQLEKAQQSIDKALTGNHQTFGEKHPELIGDYLHLGNIQFERAEYQAAMTAFRKVYEMSREFVGENALRTGHGQYFMGETFAAMGKTAEAATAYQQAARIYTAIGNAFELAGAYSQLAKLEREQQNWESCYAYHQKAWQVLMPELPFQRKAGPEVLPYWKAHSIADAISELAVSLKTEAKEKPTLLPDVLETFESAIALIDSQFTYYAGETAVQIRREEQLPLFEAAVETAWQLFHESQDPQYAEKAFFLSEKRKANQLRTQLQNMAALRFGGVPDSLQLQEKDLRQQMLALDARIADADETSVSGIREESYQLRQQYRALLHQLEVDFPAYYHLKHASPNQDLQSLQAVLGHKKELLSFFWGEKAVYVFLVHPSGCKMDQIPITDKLTTDLDNWLTFIRRPPNQVSPEKAVANGQSAARLAQYFLRLPMQTEALVIIPDGLLGYVPFESLLITEPAHHAYRSWEWLGTQTAISYAYSARLWQQRQGHPRGSYKGFAPTFSGGEAIASRALPGALQFNQMEVNLVNELTGGERFLGAEASESVVKQLPEAESILHFATHAIADEENMLRSRLYFASPGDSTEDGVLYAHEIYGQQWSGPLTVLSACQTGSGPLRSGEGVMSLARAFRYSGSRNVLTTLWQTDDQSVARLTSSVFQQLVDGKPLESALQLARQKHLLEADQFHAHPYFWAGYVLIGEGGEIHFSHQKSGYYWWLVFPILLIMLALIWNRTRKI